MKRTLQKTRLVLLGMMLTLFSGCADGPEKSLENNDTSGDTDDEDAGASSTDDTDRSDQSAACADFHNFLVACEIASLGVMYIDEFCDVFDDIFTDSYMEALVPCMSEVGCEGFIEMLSASTTTDGGDTDTGTEGASIMETCATAAMYDAEPEQANLDFQEHFCDYATQCDAELSEADCIDAFNSDEDMLVFMVLDETYIADADACVYPMPPCSEEVSTCIEAVGNGIGDTLSAIGK